MRPSIRVGVGAVVPEEVTLDLSTEGRVCKQILCTAVLISLLLFLYNIGSWEWLECRVCVGKGQEMRLQRWAGTRSWKALRTILGNFVLS